MSTVSVTGLSPERRARAHWGAWRAAHRLRTGTPRWIDQVSTTSEPKTIRVDLERSFGHDSMGVATLFVERLTTLLGGDAATLEGRLFVVDDERWWVLDSAMKLVAAETVAGSRRSVGGVVLAVGSHAGQTLDAVGEDLPAGMPDTLVELFEAMHPGANNERDSLAWACKALETSALDVVRACLDPGLHGLAANSRADACWELIAAAAKAKHPSFIATRPSGHWTKSAVVGSVSGAPPKPSGGHGPVPPSAPTGYLKWIRSVPADEANDSALKQIYEGWTQRKEIDGNARDALLDARREANRKHRDGSRKDFDVLAPLPSLTSPDRAKHGAPGVPLVDALWAVRQLRAAFPGQLAAAEGVRLRVTKVALRVTAPGDHEVTLFPPGSGDLRKFGLALAERVKSSKQPNENVYEVVVDLAPESGAAFRLPLAFAWRWKETPTSGERRKGALARDTTRFVEVAAGLGAIKSSHPSRQAALTGAHSSMAALATAWNTCAAVLDEQAGLTTASGIQPEVQAFLEAYERAAEELAGLFKSVGPLATRVADVPLERFLGFACSRPEDGEHLLFGYHPVRLQRQNAQEMWALEEIHRELKEVATLQDIPVVSTPEVRGAPSVLWSAATDSTLSLIVSSSTGADPWCESFRRVAQPTDAPADLVEPLRPVFVMLSHLWPGLSRRLDVVLDQDSSVADGLRPLALLADLVPGSDRAITGGIDLYADLPEATTSAVVDADEAEEKRARVRAAMTADLSGDPRRALTLHPMLPGDESLRHHVALLVRPSHGQTEWTTRSYPDTGESDAAMAWDDDARAWNRPMVSSAVNAKLERLFQRLVVLRKRRDEDALERCFAQTLAAGEDHAVGKRILTAVQRCTSRSARAIVVDRVYGAEALTVGVTDSEQRVTYADFDRKSGWRVTVVARSDRAPDAERTAVQRGLSKRFSGADDVRMTQLAERVVESTHRTVPAVLRALVRLGSEDHHEMEGELVGHLGVALLVSSARAPTAPSAGMAVALGRWSDPAPEGTLLLSMDSLQHWTWTRRSGTRGDFLALVPLPDGRVCIAAIESKGSVGRDSAQDGAPQAAVAREKLRERFEAPERSRERTELLSCVAQEAFRAKSAQREVYDRIAAGRKLIFESVSVETSMTGTGLTVARVLPDVLTVRIGGVGGLLSVAGIP